MSKDIAIALGSAAIGNPAVACGFLAKYALFAGVEQLALWVCDHGAENLARYCAEGDAAIYASYLKTLDFVVDFAVKHGVCGALNKKLATANGYSARQLNLNKPREFKDGGSSTKTMFSGNSLEQWHLLDRAERLRIQGAFVNQNVARGFWKKERRINGHEAWKDLRKKNTYYTKDGSHGDIEVWHVSGKKAYHQGSMEPIDGTIYRHPNHDPQRFE